MILRGYGSACRADVGHRCIDPAAYGTLAPRVLRLCCARSHNLMKDGLGMTATFEAIPGMGHSGAVWFRILSSTRERRSASGGGGGGGVRRVCPKFFPRNVDCVRLAVRVASVRAC